MGAFLRSVSRLCPETVVFSQPWNSCLAHDDTTSDSSKQLVVLVWRVSRFGGPFGYSPLFIGWHTLVGGQGRSQIIRVGHRMGSLPVGFRVSTVVDS